jgi:hypothetical protein
MRTLQKICYLRSAHISRPDHNPPHRPAHLASQPLGPRVPLAYFAEDVFFFDSRLPFSAPSLSPLTDAWAPLVNSFLHPAPADPDCATTESRCVRPLRAAAPHLEMPPRAVTRPTITPPSSSRALTRRDEPIYSAIEATPSPAVTLPSPPRHPSSRPYKRATPPSKHPAPSPRLTGAPPPIHILLHPHRAPLTTPLRCELHLSLLAPCHP